MSDQIRQIRAVYDQDSITVYQAYNASIAKAAVDNQRLDASPLFRSDRMTWIKPSWNWMMYRSGYSYKDANQSNILAIKLKRSFFEKLLLAGVLSEARDVKRDEMTIRVQWDPERSVRIGRLDGQVNGNGGGEIRSIQIGVPKGWTAALIGEGIVEIEDVTWKARELKMVLDQSKENKKDIGQEELTAMGLVPEEKVYILPEEVARVVGTTSD